jgi:hypothetical protein
MAQETITLGRSTGVRATFGPEGLSATFGKLFKKELQTGDALFDEHVHVKTETEDATANLLESEDVRTVIERVVSEGGAVAIDDKTVTFELPKGVTLEPALKSALIEAVGQ